MEVKISKLSQNDTTALKELLSVFEVVFEMEPFIVPDDAYLRGLLLNPDMMFMVAEADGKVVGGLSAYVLAQYYSKEKHAYIHDVAISTAYQRKGIGKKLIAAFNNYCQTMNYAEVFVAAEKEDAHAVEFYRATGADELESVHFFYKLNSK